MAPVVEAARAAQGIDSLVCVTGQHRQLLDEVLGLFRITPDADLNVMVPDQDLVGLTAAVLRGLDPVLARLAPDRVLVHGDTTTAFVASLAAFYRRIPVGHVEAGLRTGDRHAPWPEEMNRRLADVLADRHYAPTERAAGALRAEGVPDGRIRVTGNTVIDALLHTRSRLAREPAMEAAFATRFPFLHDGRRTVLVTGHRRESFGPGLEDTCRALVRLAGRDDVKVVYAVHPNPNVAGPVSRLMGGEARIHLIAPQPYAAFVYLMDQADLIVTDSGGIQEEAPSLGKPVLVTRAVTERPEAVAAGTVRLVGTDADRIVGEATRLLDDAAAYGAMSRCHNPYGDGKASGRIVEDLLRDTGV